MKLQYDIDNSLVELIKKFEGYSNKAYKDPSSGNLPITIGYGSTKWLDGRNIKLGETITKDLANQLLKKDIVNIAIFLYNTTPNFESYNKNQQNALISFSYNTGWHYGKENYDTLNKGIKNKDINLISKVLLLYINKGTPSENGLIFRRKEEIKLFNTLIIT